MLVYLRDWICSDNWLRAARRLSIIGCRCWDFLSHPVSVYCDWADQ